MGLVLITHDLGVVARHADRVAVLYAGRVMEEGDAKQVFAAPSHPYTVSLFRSIPGLDAPASVELASIAGQPPSPESRPAGCPFEPRCFLAAGDPTCRTQPPMLEPAGSAGHLTRCWKWRDLPADARQP